MTAERLQEELALRQTELDKIATIDVKIAAEMKSLNDRMVTMKVRGAHLRGYAHRWRHLWNARSPLHVNTRQEEMRRYADLDGLRARAAAVKSDLEARIVEYGRRRDGLRKTVTGLVGEHEKKRAALARDPQATALAELEGKIRSYEQSVFAMRECE